MKRRDLLLAMLIAALLSVSGTSQETPSKGKLETPETKSSNRLPNNYGKLGLSEEQRKKIYAIQAEYREKIDSLLREVEDLRAQETLEIQNTLSASQQAELLKLLEDTRKKREEKKVKN